METKKLIETFPKGNPARQIDIFKAIDYYIGLENVYEIESSINFTLISEEKTCIFINKNLPFKVKHFILAHEFVEYLMQKQKPFANFPYYIYKGRDKKFQWKVNKIASELLVPEVVLKKIISEALLYTDRIKSPLVNELSNYFEVSINVIKIRLKSFGYEVVL